MRENYDFGDGQFVHKSYLDVFDHGANMLSIMFAPYLKIVHKKGQVINSCSLEEFKRRFKITSDILEPMQELWAKDKNIILSGGKMIDFVLNKNRSESLSDYDCFTVGEPSKLKLHINIEGLGYSRTANLGYVTEYIDDKKFGVVHIQAIHFSYACIEAIIESFDIRACAIACDGERIYWAKGALQDVRDKRIVMLNPKSDFKIFNRIHKYLEKGYQIAKPDLAIASICFLNNVNRCAKNEELSKDIVYRDICNAREARESYTPPENDATAIDPAYV